MCAKDPDLEYIATTTGKPLEEVKAQFEENKKTVKEDVDFLNKNGIARIFDRAELNVTQETPVKIADIICYCHYKEKSFTLTLTNCVQTNTTWALGDGVEPKGEAIADLIALKKEKDTKFANSGLGKMAAAAAVAEAEQAKAEAEKAKRDSTARRAADAQRLTDRVTAAKAGNIPKAYQATLFPERDRINYTPYFHTELFGQSLLGYYIDRTGKTVYVDKIKYSDLYTMMFGPALEPPLSDFNNIAAYHVGDQLFVQFEPGTQIAQVGFSMGDAPALPPEALLVSEGAIRKLVSAHKIGGDISGVKLDGVSADRLFQKLDENVTTFTSMTMQFKKRMALLVGDKYYPYSFSADGNLITREAGGQWDTKDAKTVTVNGVNQMTNILGVTTSTFVADVKRDGMAGMETIMYRVRGPL